MLCLLAARKKKPPLPKLLLPPWKLPLLLLPLTLPLLPLTLLLPLMPLLLLLTLPLLLLLPPLATNRSNANEKAGLRAGFFITFSPTIIKAIGLDG